MLPDWPRQPDLSPVTTVDEPIGQPLTSELTGRAYYPSDLGYCDTPNPYTPQWPEEDSCTPPPTT